MKRTEPRLLRGRHFSILVSAIAALVAWNISPVQGIAQSPGKNKASLTRSLNAQQKRAWKVTGKKLRKVLKQRRLRRSKVGMVVINPRGQILFAHNASKALIPASTTKLFTIATALEVLGPHYRFETKVYSTAKISPAGVLQGNLYIKGSGDPRLRSEEMWRIARDLYNMGLRRIKGRVVFDDSVFDRKRWIPGLKDHLHQRYRPYLAPVGGFAVNYSCLAIALRPGRKAGQPARVTLDPPTRYVRKIINRTTTVEKGWRMRIKFKLRKRGGRDILIIRGRVPRRAQPRTYWRRISNPGWYAAFVFAHFLRKQRIRVSRWPRRGKVPTSARTLYTHRSPYLSALLQFAGKYSSNFSTEMVLKTLGAQQVSEPGTWSKGLSVVQKWMKKRNILKGRFRMINGSGLGRRNRFTPLQMVRLLQVMNRNFATRSDFFVAQPTAGRDGTLQRRFKGTDVAGRMRAKTGTIDGVSTLAGYVKTKGGQMLLFFMGMNGSKRKTGLFRRVQETLGQILVRHQRRPNQR
jgi:D-alanyl-D-alanine carboxypeptidase/D-alanyl-D-alanine-endopeptidase (penicillin-binding protein 4)